MNFSFNFWKLTKKVYVKKWFQLSDLKLFLITGRFAICGPLMMNSFSNWIKFVQWMEWNFLIGAEHIIIYAYETSHSIASLLHFYLSIGMLELIVWPSKNLCIGIGKDYYCQWTRINDCLYRMMYRYQFCITKTCFSWRGQGLSISLTSFQDLWWTFKALVGNSRLIRVFIFQGCLKYFISIFGSRKII